MTDDLKKQFIEKFCFEGAEIYIEDSTPFEEVWAFFEAALVKKEEEFDKYFSQENMRLYSELEAMKKENESLENQKTVYGMYENTLKEKLKRMTEALEHLKRHEIPCTYTDCGVDNSSLESRPTICLTAKKALDEGE